MGPTWENFSNEDVVRRNVSIETVGVVNRFGDFRTAHWCNIGPILYAQNTELNAYVCHSTHRYRIFINLIQFNQPVIDGEFTPEMTAILCCAIFTAGIAFPNICSFIGRTKIVLVWSTTCMAVNLAALGVYCVLQGTFGHIIDDYKVLPLVFLGFFYFCFAIGPHSYTWQYVQETVPAEHFFHIRNLLVAVSWSVIFAITKALPRLIRRIGVGWLFFYMSLMCLFLTIFCAVAVPEHKKLPEEKKLVYASESSEGDVWCNFIFNRRLSKEDQKK